MQKSTYMPKAGDQDRRWVLIDLEGAVLGRAATRIANVLRGKHKPTFTPHLDMGDFVVAINAEKIQLTGKKLTDKSYYRHSGYRGGLKTRSAGEILQKKPEELIRLAVSGMLPKNKSRKHFLKKLKVYAGAEHPHTAQEPQPIGLNDKEMTAKVPAPAKAKPEKPAAAPAKAKAPKKAAPKATATSETKPKAKATATKAATKTETKEKSAHKKQEKT